MRVCSEPGCPNLIEDSGYCRAHRREREQRRGSRQKRGYDAAHDRERARWEPAVRTGRITCWRCGNRIAPEQSWDLGHTDDRKQYAGPEHVACNRAAGGRAAHR